MQGQRDRGADGPESPDFDDEPEALPPLGPLTGAEAIGIEGEDDDAEPSTDDESLDLDDAEAGGDVDDELDLEAEDSVLGAEGEGDSELEVGDDVPDGEERGHTEGNEPAGVDFDEGDDVVVPPSGAAGVDDGAEGLFETHDETSDESDLRPFDHNEPPPLGQHEGDDGRVGRDGAPHDADHADDDTLDPSIRSDLA